MSSKKVRQTKFKPTQVFVDRIVATSHLWQWLAVLGPDTGDTGCAWFCNNCALFYLAAVAFYLQ
jgi:hypothetical protein